LFSITNARPEILGHPRGDETGDVIDGAAGRERQDEADRPLRILGGTGTRRDQAKGR
jgi:hypothetical protein